MNVKLELQKIRESGSKIIIVGVGISGIETIKFCIKSKLNYLAVERENKENYYAKANMLAKSFIENFEKFSEMASDEILAAAPKVISFA